MKARDRLTEEISDYLRDEDQSVNQSFLIIVIIMISLFVLLRDSTIKSLIFLPNTYIEE